MGWGEEVRWASLEEGVSGMRGRLTRGTGRYRMNALRVWSALEVRRVVPSGDLRGVSGVVMGERGGVGGVTIGRF